MLLIIEEFLKWARQYAFFFRIQDKATTLHRDIIPYLLILAERRVVVDTDMGRIWMTGLRNEFLVKVLA